MLRHLVLALAIAAPLHAQTQLTPEVLLFDTPSGNVVVAFGAEGAFTVGPLSVASTQTIQAALAGRTSSATRYVVVGAEDATRSEGDGGWQRLGAFVAVHENASGRLRGEARRIQAIGADLPRVAYSEVIKFALNGRAYHAVHQKAGYSDADVLVHLEADGVVYLGESFPGDGYPIIDSAQGGTLDGLIQTLDPWAGGGGGDRFVGARGPAVSRAEVRALRDMLVTMRDRVRALARAGQTADQVVAAHPSREFDARWGHGRVTPEVFVREIYRAVR